ncbi:MAG: metallophosphoesterase [Spirochaetales bacterium]|jgi:uncharacterized protein|nr:metallophosphoesterase [Spirochaetales bacterium]
MKILCIADHKDPIVYSSHAKHRFHDIDLILGAGDLDLEYYGFIVSSLNKPLLFVFGNHNLKRISFFNRKYRQELGKPIDSDNPFGNSFGSTYIGGKVARQNGLLIAGLGGSRKYNQGINQYSERQMFMQIVKIWPQLLWNRIFRGRYVDILLTHAAPSGIGDRDDLCHTGFKMFLKFMKWFRPRYLIHGHIHLYDMNAEREHQYLDTKIINAYNHYVFDLEVDGEQPV